MLYPGYLTRDATFIRGYVQTWYLGDWQSPLMAIVPGTGDVPSSYLPVGSASLANFRTVAIVLTQTIDDNSILP